MHCLEITDPLAAILQCRPSRDEVNIGFVVVLHTTLQIVDAIWASVSAPEVLGEDPSHVLPTVDRFRRQSLDPCSCSLNEHQRQETHCFEVCAAVDLEGSVVVRQPCLRVG